MSNFLAIATVTATIKQLLLDNVANDVSGINVSTNPPDIFQGQTLGNQLNLFLYQIQLNPSYRNDDVPQRDGDGNVIKLPRVGLNLNYLITAYGEGNDDLQAQQIMASAIRILHENPILTQKLITNALRANSAISNSDLQNQIESVRLSPHPLSFEEITKLWSIFFQTSYRLSFAYQATVILLDGLSDVKPVLPVTQRNLFVYPFSQPFIESINPQIIEWDANAKITIKGRNLSSAKISIMFGTHEQQINNVIVNDQISLAIPDIPAGVVPVQIVHKSTPSMDLPPDRVYEESNLFPLLIVPRITSIQQNLPNGTPQLTVNFVPTAMPGQQISVMAGDRTLQVPTPSAPTRQVVVNTQESVPPGSYVGIRIDSVESKFTQV